MLDYLLCPPTIQENNFLGTRKKSGLYYLTNETKNAFTLKDAITFLKQAATFFEMLEQDAASNDKPEMIEMCRVCRVIKGNLLFIAIDHLTHNPNKPLQDAEKQCIVQTMVIIHNMWQDMSELQDMTDMLQPLYLRINDVMEYFNLWERIESDSLEDTDIDDVETDIDDIDTNIDDIDDIETDLDTQHEHYKPDSEIQQIIKNLEESSETSLKVSVVDYKENHNYYGELNKLIGLNRVKDVLNKQIAAFRFQKARQKQHPDLKTTLSFNCLFLGNPGTGKTTVARELAGILRQEGLLKSGHYVEVKAADIISPYIGVSAKNAQLAIYKAIDGLLFIDEAYALMGHGGTKGNASNEVIDTLTPLIENYRDRLCVVLAGYDTEMTEMVEKTNTGFSSRFQNMVHFENYNASEMLKIFELMSNAKHLILSSDIKKRIQQVFNCFEEVSTQIPTFANARTVRSFIEKIEARMGERFVSKPSQEMDMDAIYLSDTELTDAEIWSVLGVVKHSANTLPFAGNDYIGHLRELLSLEEKIIPQKTHTPNSEHQQKGEGNGIIMTDTKQLAIKFYDCLRKTTQLPDGTSKDIYIPHYITSQVFIPYIQMMRSQGINYTLLDISDPEFEDILHNGCCWQNCLKILDQFCDNNPEYIGGNLFIVGGEDVIPSPKVSNPVWKKCYDAKEKETKYREKDLEVDLLYSYRSEDIRFTKHLELDYEHLFDSNQSCRFAVGRLPMENGVVSEKRRNEILSYFERAIKSFVATDTKPTGIEIKNHLVTAAETLNIVSHMMTTKMPLLPLQEEARLVEGNIFLSPILEIPDTNNIEEIIQYSNGCQRYVAALRKADMLTFVSHGASLAESDGCYGEDNRTKQFYTAFVPELFQICPAKIVGSVCCWGARYINYRVEESMVLMAMAKNVLIYVGACRSALGVFDKHIKEGVNLAFTPVLLSQFEQNLLNGVPAGVALHNAKMDYLKSTPGNDLEADLLTILEFNLYGDPALSLTQSSQFTRKHELSQYTPTKHNKQLFTRMKERTFVFNTVCDQSNMTLLDRIRQHTNENLMYIRERINKQVYQQFGLQPRELSSIVTIKTNGKADGYIFQYKRECTNFEQITFVQTNSNGEIISVLGTL